MIKFRGLEKLKLDQQNRISLPKKYKNQLTTHIKNKHYNTNQLKTLFITHDLLPHRKCLNIYNYENWIELENRILKQGGVNDRSRYFASYIIGHSHEITLDKSCKFTMPTNLIEFAQLDKEIILLGVSSHAEVWNKNLYQEYQKKQESLLTEEFLNTIPN